MAHLTDITLAVHNAQYDAVKNTVVLTIPTQDIDLYAEYRRLTETLQAQGVNRLDAIRIVDSMARTAERELLLITLSNLVTQEE